MAFPGSEELVATAEAALGRTLSEPHRARLIRENGGEIRALREYWTLYPVWDPTNRKTMGRTANHILRENEALRRDWPDVLPEGWVAIADNGGGDLLVLSPTDDFVRFWDHETGELTPVDVRWK
jgi:SMI1 / KNR4 family (SUKH-1)